jgi:alkylhydroperoxidase/carboxymuconolactone decarboxylase family protein YurZ
MTTARPGGWQTMLQKGAPALSKQVADLQQTILADGALSSKTKTLMMLMADALLGHDEGVTNLARRARSLGASDAEISETLGMAFLMGGLPGVVTARSAFRE